MAEMSFNRILAIRAAAAGPYVIVGPCIDCGTEQPLVNMPQMFAVSVAICRTCREARTGVPDRRNMIRGKATISSTELFQNHSGIIPARGLLPASTPVEKTEDPEDPSDG
jgi:hypothetical protein